MEQNIFDYLVEGLDINAFYSFIDSKTDIAKNTKICFFISLFVLSFKVLTHNQGALFVC